MRTSENRWRTSLPLEQEASIIDRALQATGVGVYEYDVATGHRRFSAVCKALWGLRPDEEPTAARIEALIHPDDRDIALHEARESLRPNGCGDFQFEHRIIRPDGQVRWLQIRGRTEFEVSAGLHRPRRSAGIMLDVTGQKVVDAAREAEWRTLVDAIPTLAWMAEADGSVFWYNHRWYDYTGTTSIDMQGSGWESVHDSQELPHIKARWRTCIAAGQPFQMTIPLKGADGVFRPFFTRVVPLKNDRGEVSRWFGTNTDVSPERERQELEARVQEEVRARESAQAILAHAQRLEALGQLAGGIAHDFNNVLQAISGGLSLVQKRAHYPEDVQRFARMAFNAASRGASVTARLLAFARKGELKAVPVCVQSLMENLREILSSTLGAGVTIQMDVDYDAPPLFADKAQLETVMVNLAVNARDAMPSGGILRLSAHSEVITGPASNRPPLKAGCYLRLELSDTGNGMDAATLRRAAEPFFTTKKPGEGTGLGLAMARGFAQQSGGGLWIDSVPGRGTTVTLWFPQASAAAHEDAMTAEGATPAPAASSVILVADDDQMVRDTLVRELQERGYSVLQASDGLSALECLDKGAGVDLLITDYSMPGMNGLVLAEEVRRRHARMPVLLLTGYADANVRNDVEAMQDGAISLLRKPVPADELAHHAAALLARTSQAG
jgi:PAS domain S-box-containing protein